MRQEFLTKIDEFENYLLLEKKYSKNTIDSYHNDLMQFQSHFNNLKAITNNDIKKYIQIISKEKNAKSVSRNISTLKSFYKFLLIEKYIDKNPMINISSPKIKKDLPKVLNEEEIIKLLNIPLTDSYSYRNKAMIELMYSSGLRVSELINLKISDIDLDNDIVRIFGKGSKERIIPLGNTTLRYLREYVENVRPLLIKTEEEPSLFINAGQRDVLKLSTNRGYEIEGTLDHKLKEH